MFHAGSWTFYRIYKILYYSKIDLNNNFSKDFFQLLVVRIYNIDQLIFFLIIECLASNTKKTLLSSILVLYQVVECFYIFKYLIGWIYIWLKTTKQFFACRKSRCLCKSACALCCFYPSSLKIIICVYSNR